jgi:prolyl 4-hydroxylase
MDLPQSNMEEIFIKEVIIPTEVDNIFTIDECKYIIDESEKYALNNISDKYPTGWVTDRHQIKPTTDLDIFNIPNIASMIVNTIYKKVYPEFENKFNSFPHMFNIYNNDLRISDIFIVKYEEGKQNSLDIHRDQSSVSFNILLNNTNEFDDGGTEFYINNKSYKYKNKQGSGVLSFGKVEHKGIPITSGIRYILVGFIYSIRDSEYASKVQNKAIKNKEYFIDECKDKEKIENRLYNIFNTNLIEQINNISLFKRYKNHNNFTHLNSILNQQLNNNLDLYKVYDNPIFKNINLNYPGLKKKYHNPNIYVVDKFLNEHECDELINKVKNNMQESKVENPQTNTNAIYNKIRNNTVHYYKKNDNITKNIKNKITKLTNIDIAHMEPIQISKYTNNQKYTSHYDYLWSDNERSNNRICSVLIYLNDVKNGGKTIFNTLDLSIQPKLGSALVFFPSLLNKEADMRLIHEGNNAINDKWIALIWIRAHKFAAK